MRLASLLLVSALAAAAPAAAAEPAIASLTAAARNGHVSVAFSLRNAFASPEIVRALQSGAQTGFTYRIEMYRSRPNWLDQRVGRARIDVICTFDSTTREYTLSYRRDRKLVRSQTFSDLALLEQKMTTVAEDDLFSTSQRPYKLVVRVRAELIRDYLFYVVPWDLTTDWKETRVRAAEKR